MAAQDQTQGHEREQHVYTHRNPKQAAQRQRPGERIAHGQNSPTKGSHCQGDLEILTSGIIAGNHAFHKW